MDQIRKAVHQFLPEKPQNPQSFLPALTFILSSKLLHLSIMFLRYLLYVLLIYMAYKFIVGFLIPVYKTTKQVKRQFRDIQQKMEEQQQQHGSNTNPQASGFNSGANPQKSKAGDYIDFEEVKD